MFLLCQKRSHFFLRTLFLLNSDSPLVLLQCALVGRDEHCRRSASLSIRLPERLRWIGPGQPVQTRWGDQVTWVLSRCAGWTGGRVSWSSCQSCCTCNSVVYIPHVLPFSTRVSNGVLIYFIKQDGKPSNLPWLVITPLVMHVRLLANIVEWRRTSCVLTLKRHHSFQGNKMKVQN